MTLLLKKMRKSAKSICITISCLFVVPIFAQVSSYKIDKKITKNEQKRLNIAVASYKRKHDYQSLLVVFQYIRLGMTKNEVEALLGQPDYSPCEGQYYYGSDGVCSSGEEEPPGPCGVVVVYQTDSNVYILKNCWFGSIRE